MPVPESIRAVPRPRNTVVVDSGHEGARRYAVRERSGVKYGPGGRSRPINGRVIGHICNDVFVPVGTIAPTASKGPDELSYGAATFVYSETTDLLHDLLAVYPPEDAYAILCVAMIRTMKPEVKIRRLSTEYRRTFVSRFYAGVHLSITPAGSSSWSEKTAKKGALFTSAACRALQQITTSSLTACSSRIRAR